MHRLKSLRNVFLLAVLLLTIPSAISQTVTPWLTSSNKTKLLQQQPTVSFGANSGSASATITVNPATTYQTMDGFGFCLTEGSAEVISSLSLSTQTTLLNELFDTSSGLGISVLRISIGASDLSSSSYSYNETAGDVTMANFSLTGPDLNYLIPILKKILLINPNIKILATPWTAPRWMKTIPSWIGGSLSPTYYAAYANYFVKYFDAMKAKGINIWAITPQNEPENPNNEPSMLMNSTEQINFINNHLGPAMATAGYSGIKIIAFDHNCDNTAYPIAVCNNSSYVDGAAFHLYAGAISALTTVKNATGKNVYFTEQYTATTGSFSGDLGWHLQNVVFGSATNWAKAIIEWNLANNPTYGPHTSSGCATCLGAVTINTASTYTRNVSYYIIGQISKFVRSGAVRILGSSSNSSMYSTAFKNPDGSIAVLAYNSNSASQSLKIILGSQAFIYTVPATTAATFVWNPTASAVAEVTLNGITLSPNPGRSVVTLKHSQQPDEIKSISFISLDGKIALNQSIDADEKESSINVSALATGMYLVKIDGKKQTQFSRFIKQ